MNASLFAGQVIKRPFSLILIGLSLLSYVTPSMAIAQVAPNSRYQSIVSYGSAAPVGGQTFTTFSSVVLSANGNWIGFEGFHTPFGSVDNGVFRYSTSAGTISKIISKHDAVPGGTFDMAQSSANRQLSINNLGVMAFNGTIGGATGGTNTGWYIGSGGAVSEMLREGNTAPGGGGTFGNLGTGVLDIQFRGINDLSQTTFQTRVVGSPGGLIDDWRLFRADSAGPNAIAVEGQPAPSGTYSTFSSVEMNDIGGAVITGTNATANIGNKVWYMAPSGSMSDLVHITNSGAGGTGTAVGNIRSSSGFPSINNLGDVVFSGWTNAGGTGTEDTYIFRTSTAGGTPTVLLAENTAAPDGNGVFANMVLSTSHLNDAGQYATGLSLRSTSGATSDDSGIYRIGFDGSVTKMFREGQAALSGNGTFAQLSISEFAFNNSGNVAMLTNYNGTSGGIVDNTAIVITDGIDYFEVAREGKPVGSQTISSLSFYNSVYGNDRSTSGLNDYGQVAYSQNLTGVNNRSIELWTPDLHHRGGTSAFDDRTKWTLSIKPAAVHDVFIGTNGKSDVSLTGVQTVRNLTIGGNSQAILQVEYGAQLNVTGQLVVKNNGTLIMTGLTSLGVGSLEDTSKVRGSSNSTISVHATLSPGGDDIGQVDFAGSLLLAPTTTTLIQLGGIDPLQYDHITGLSRLNMNGSLLIDLVNGFSLADNQQFLIFDVFGSSTGQFSGLGEGALVGTFGNHNLYISYASGDGNDLSLFTTTAVPETNSLLLLTITGLLIIHRRKRGNPS
jgi:hypothetical protein